MALPDAQPGPLNSWKEVARFLGVSVRTAQRWERERGLPVLRLDGDKGRVVADPERLQAWKQKILGGPSWWSDARLLRRYAAASTLLLVTLAALFAVRALFAGRPGPLASARPEFQSLVASDASGRELWRYRFTEVLGQDGYYSDAAGRTMWIGDLDGDGEVEVLFPYLPIRASQVGTALYCFSSHGTVKWSFKPGRSVADASAATFSGNYILTDWAVWRDGARGPWRVVATSQHDTHHPCQVTVLDAAGRATGEYWHSGHLDYVDVSDLDGDGRAEIFLIGVNNELNEAELIVLDSAAVAGAAALPPGSSRQILGFPAAREKRIVRFPRTCVNRATGLYNLGKGVRVADHKVMVRVQEDGRDPHTAAFYTLDRNLRVTSAELSDGWRNLHRQLERAGRLDHAVTSGELERVRSLVH